MEWLNYHHLMYFWAVARSGGIANASRELLVSEPTISGQLKELDKALGERLFVRSGRKLELTEMGKLVFDYANDIFSLGRELMDSVKQRPTDRPLRLVVGISDSLPKLVARTLLEPALRMENVHLICREGRLDELLIELYRFRVDLVLSDAPAGSAVSVRTFSHLLGECGVSFFATNAVRRRLTGSFPALLDGTAVIWPTENTALRRQLDTWLDTHKIRPHLKAEVQDSALAHTFGQIGLGVFPGPTIVESDICTQHQVEVIGQTSDITERFYAISLDRKLRHPAVVEISASAREQFSKLGRKQRPSKRSKTGKRKKAN